MRKFAITFIAAVVAAAPASQLEAASLRGSPAAMQQQNGAAVAHELDFYRTGDEVGAAAARRELVELTGNADYQVADFVSFPYVRPDLLTFTERLGAQYRDACGETLVVTSATRPIAAQPANSHALSVHPAGMALDLRVSQNTACRNWLEAALLGMEARGLINATREFHPPHYHVAVFPREYAAYAAERIAEEEAERRASAFAGRVLPIERVEAPGTTAPGAVRIGALPGPMRLKVIVLSHLIEAIRAI